MGLDFDPIDYCRTLARTPSPYKCPVEKCTKSYKSIYGLQYHLVNFDHETNTQISHITPTSSRKKGNRGTPGNGAQGSRVSPKGGAGGGGLANFGSPKEGLTYSDALKVVQFDIDEKSIKVSTVDPLAMISMEDYDELVKKGDAPRVQELPPEQHIPLPEAKFKRVENYSICDAPHRPNAYIRFIEKTPEELDGEIEYDVDEEDTIWLQEMNEERAETGLSAVSIDTLELLMDRLEKESYFQATANGKIGADVDDDAVCSICLDGECANTNVILFCDMCNLAVHQDCYGVPYIPEGQWLCRRCLQSPSRPVECVLCPNTGGAFKQTDHNQWAHVVCALWIPEVRFANTVFLEPIDSIETIPAARWRLTCYICKQKGVGACIQCQRNSCYAAFHVTCAQQAGLHMHMDTVKDANNEAHPVSVQKVAYCDAHCPTNGTNGENLNLSNAEAERLRQKSREKMKAARKTLAIKRESVPLILIPTIPADRVHEITSLIHFQKKAQFIQRLIAYWTLKREHRNGVPLLRRLQSQGQSHQNRGIEGSPNASELNQQLKYWQCLRQDLERSRLLCELVRKREKLKAAFIRIKEQCIMMQLNPLEAAMNRLLEQLCAKDPQEIFSEPVDIDEVPDYTDVVKQPMDFSTMRSKLRSGEYKTLDNMEYDFNLMVKNCLAYNNKDTIFYRAGTKMRDQGAALFKSTRKELIKNGILEQPQSDDSLANEVDMGLTLLLKTEHTTQERLDQLHILMEKSMRIKHASIRNKRVKQIRIELTKTKKTMTRRLSLDISLIKALKKDQENSSSSDSSQSDVEKDSKMRASTSKQQVTPPTSPVKSINNSASPSGVNRRTAVLFTRKAQAASLKKTETIAANDDNTSFNNQTPTPLSSQTSPSSALSPATNEANSKMPKKITRARRNTSIGIAEPGPSNLTSPLSSFLEKKNISPNAIGTTITAATGAINKKLSPVKEKFATTDSIPESFRCYRGPRLGLSSDSDESQLCFSDSTCSSCSGSGSDFGSSNDDDEDLFSGSDGDDAEHSNTEPYNKSVPPFTSNLASSSHFTKNKPNGSVFSAKASTSNTAESSSVSSPTQASATESNSELKTFEPLQLVWAKCRGYPWYPALIIDPKIRKGFIYNGVPLPTPPTDVLALRKDKTEPVYLVLFFDAKRTWQWLPPNKLEFLGSDDQLDKVKLTESRKQSKAVKKAYDDALRYNKQVSDLKGQGPGAIA